MTPAAADWVYREVLTQRFRESAGAVMWTGAREHRRDEGPGAAMLRTCRCQYGLCGHCGDGRPDRCTHRNWTPPAGPDTWIQGRGGAALVPVWRVGKPCAWLCPNARVGQLELFALAGGAR